MAETTTPSWRDTLNLPRTDFPMRGDLVRSEPHSQQRWAEADLYGRMLEARRDGTPFRFHDGPPYANGAIHCGHLLNKVLKDFVVRSRMLAGRACPFVPGWDCHGLPIEHMVLQELHAAGTAEALAALPEDERRRSIRSTCAEYATRWIEFQAAQMQRLLTLADYANPYRTMDPAYEQAVLEVFADLLEEGVVTRRLKPVHWSIANQTALAEAELEYEDREDRSIHVTFEATDPVALGAAFGVEVPGGASLMIWTTTPWTLPANRAIAVHEDLRYALVRLGERVTVLASGRVEAVAEATDHAPTEVLAEVDGTALVGLACRHPFLEIEVPVVAGEHVTLEDGTGLVHTAPGHGHEDHLVGLREGLEIACPVRGDGTFDDTVPAWLRGQSVWDANDLVVERLAGSGHLVHDGRIVHSYPHDWRSRTPVIFRSTEQWFIEVDAPLRTRGRSLRDLALEACDAIDFVPVWGRNRLQGMLESRPDWCLSRQRAWGLPIPAFRSPDGTVFMTPASVRAVAETIAQRGADAWFEETPTQLLGVYDPSADPDAPADLDPATLVPMHDIFDVWFESGSSWRAVMDQQGDGGPSDLYLEGSDQHRGWFQLSLLPALGVTGAPPFGTLLTHGFVVDGEGRKMSKSLGNTLDVDALVDRFGADVCRWWVASLAVETDIRADEDRVAAASESYRKVRNTLRFLLGNLGDYESTPGPEPSPTSLDAWFLAEACAMRGAVLDAYEAYDFRRAHRALYAFCSETCSAIYCAAVKDRLYCDRADSPRRRATQAAMRSVLEILCRLLAPLLPHTADEAWRALHGDDACVHLETVADDPIVEADSSWTNVMTVREQAMKALEEAKEEGLDNPLDTGLILPDAEGALGSFEADLADLCGVSRVTLSPGADAVVVEDLRDQPRCDRSWRRDATVRQRGEAGWLSDRDAEAAGVV